jgi:hypothetical protein
MRNHTIPRIHQRGLYQKVKRDLRRLKTQQRRIEGI